MSLGDGRGSSQFTVTGCQALRCKYPGPDSNRHGLAAKGF
jgi:hypothetical protein